MQPDRPSLDGNITRPQYGPYGVSSLGLNSLTAWLNPAVNLRVLPFARGNRRAGRSLGLATSMTNGAPDACSYSLELHHGEMQALSCLWSFYFESQPFMPQDPKLQVE